MTLGIVLGLGILLGIYDLVLLASEGSQATISAQLYTVSKKYPVIPFLFGFLMGHLFFVQHGVVP